MSIIDGLIKPSITTNIDMSTETTTNVEKIEHHAHNHYGPTINLYISDAETAVQIAETLAQHFHPVIQPPTPTP